MTIYVSTTLTDEMFPQDFLIAIHTIPSYIAWTLVNGHEPVVSLLSSSDAALVQAVKEKFDIDLLISNSIPKIELEKGDSVLLVKSSFNRQLVDDEIVFKLWNTQR